MPAIRVESSRSTMLECSNLSGQRIEGRAYFSMNTQRCAGVYGGDSEVCGRRNCRCSSVNSAPDRSHIGYPAERFSVARLGDSGARRFRGAKRALHAAAIAWLGVSLAGVADAEPTSADKSLATQLF